MRIRKQSLDVAAVLLLILASGNPAFSFIVGKELILVGLPFLYLLYGFIRGLRIHLPDMVVPLAFSLISLAHFITFGFSALPAILGFLLKLAAAILIVRTVVNFTGIYVRIMYCLAFMGIALFLPQVIFGESLRSLIQFLAIPYSPGTLHVGFHNFNPINHMYRNSGIFWEPGAFAGYLLLALIFSVGNQIKGNKRPVLDKTNAILFVALLTTQSTTGYVAMMVFALMFVYLKYGLRYVSRLLFAASFFLTLMFVAYQTLPFLSEKIDQQFESALNRNERNELTRFGNAAYDWEHIKQRPLLGWSPYTETRVVLDVDVAEWLSGQGNGLTALAVRFGGAGFLIFCFAVYGSFLKKYRHHNYSIASLSVILMLLVGEQFLNFPLFMTLMFISREKLQKVNASIGSHGFVFSRNTQV